MAVDYISNLVDYDSFEKMAQKLATKPSFQSMSEEQQMALLQRLASNRDQQEALDTSTIIEGVSGDTSILTSSNGGGDGSSIGVGGSGVVANSESQERALEGLKELGISTGTKAAVTAGVAGLMGGLDVSDSLGYGLESALMGLPSGIANVVQTSMGIGRDLGIAGKVGKGLLSMALGAVNPALGVVASTLGTTIADTAMDYADMRNFETQKDTMENLVGELASRSGLDYAKLEGIDSKYADMEELSMSEIATLANQEVELARTSGMVKGQELANLASQASTLSAFGDAYDKAVATRNLSIEKGLANPNVDRIATLTQQAVDYGIDPNAVEAYKDVGFLEGLFGTPTYDAINSTLASQEVATAKDMGMTVADYQDRVAQAEKYGVSITGTALEDAIMAEESKNSGWGSGDWGGGGMRDDGVTTNDPWGGDPRGSWGSGDGGSSGSSGGGTSSDNNSAGDQSSNDGVGGR